jgi:poly-gamma-glutamate capsule biosynthesis protein CapA/YwtB (metallophosphatase superfamily)
MGLAMAMAAGASGQTGAGGHHHRSRANQSPVTLQWVGDIALSTQRGLPPGGLARALEPVSPQLHDAQLTLGNLEGTLSTGGTSKCGPGSIGGGTCFAFQAPPSTAQQLRRLSFGLVNQANNHSEDYGPSGRAQTLNALRAAGIAQTGLPGEITRLTVGGVRVAFLGFAPYSYDANLLDIPAAQALVRRARHSAAIVVVTIHAGAEGADQLHTPRGTQFYLGENRGNARAFAHAVINAGASIVFGSGPHVIRGIERYRGHLIAYSLGNFVGYHTLGGQGVLSQSAILRVTLSATGRVRAARWISIRLIDGLPRPEPSEQSAKLVATLSREDFPTDHYTIPPDGRFRFARARLARRTATARSGRSGAAAHPIHQAAHRDSLL